MLHLPDLGHLCVSLLSRCSKVCLQCFDDVFPSPQLRHPDRSASSQHVVLRRCGGERSCVQLPLEQLLELPAAAVWWLRYRNSHFTSTRRPFQSILQLFSGVDPLILHVAPLQQELLLANTTAGDEAVNSDGDICHNDSQSAALYFMLHHLTVCEISHRKSYTENHFPFPNIVFSHFKLEYNMRQILHLFMLTRDFEI